MDLGHHWFRCTLAHVEQLGGLLYNLHHLGDLNIDLDAAVGIVRRIGSLIFEKFGPPFYIQFLDESFEILVGTNISYFQDISETALDKSNNQPTLLLSLLGIRHNLSTTKSRGNIQGWTNLLLRIECVDKEVKVLDDNVVIEPIILLEFHVSCTSYWEIAQIPELPSQSNFFLHILEFVNILYDERFGHLSGVKLTCNHRSRSCFRIWLDLPPDPIHTIWSNNNLVYIS